MAADPWYVRQYDGPAITEGPSPYTAVTNEPPASWRPFNSSSLWNTPIPGNATATADSSAIITWLNSFTGGPTDRFCGEAGTTDDFDHPIYYAAAGDPLQRVQLSAGARDPSLLGRTHVTNLQDRLMPVPVNSPQAGGSDGHLCVVTEDTIYDLWQARSWSPGSGKIGTKWGATTSLSGDGSTDGGFGATAAGVPLIAGLIRLSELQAGLIQHALAITVRYVRNNVFAAPATGTATPDPGVVAGDSNDLTRPITGSRLQLNMSSAEITALNLPAWKTTILNAMATYGMIIMDTSASHSYTLVLESGSPDVALGNSDRWAVFGTAQGWSKSGNAYVMPLSTGVDWSRLRVVSF
jgi:hypothetical protein